MISLLNSRLSIREYYFKTNKIYSRLDDLEKELKKKINNKAENGLINNLSLIKSFSEKDYIPLLVSPNLNLFIDLSRSKTLGKIKLFLFDGIQFK